MMRECLAYNVCLSHLAPKPREYKYQLGN